MIRSDIFTAADSGGLAASVIRPRWPVPANVHALITTRAGGMSCGPYASLDLGAHVGDEPEAVARNRALLRELLPAEPEWMEQVHGCNVIEADVVSANSVPRADGAVTRAPRVVCAVLTADCLPVLLADRDGTVVGIAHAGWRGLAAGVIEATIARMGVAASALVAYLGPAIGPRAYEVGEDVREVFIARSAAVGDAFEPIGRGKYLADLYRLARQRLTEAGVTAVGGGDFCTYTDPRFYSYRRDRTTGRMASLVWME